MNASATRWVRMVGVALAVSSLQVQADDYGLTWSRAGGGTTVSSGGDYELVATVGQPDAGGMSGGHYDLDGGFWVVESDAPEPCPGDLDGDGDTDQSDLGILLAAWGIDDGGDLDGDNDTDQSDLGILLADWGCTP
jgi:hypothetical protein